MDVLAVLRRGLRGVVMHQKSRVENVFLAAASESSQRDARIGKNHVIFAVLCTRHIDDTLWRPDGTGGGFRLSRGGISRAPAA
jgi:hypothetical protein